MMTWSVTMTHSAGVEIYAGSAPSWVAARAAGLAATQARHHRFPGGPGSRYTLEVQGRTVAILATGVDESGAPAHAEFAELLDRIDTAPIPPTLNTVSLYSAISAVSLPR